MNSVDNNEPLSLVAVLFTACLSLSKLVSCETVEGLSLVFNTCISVYAVGFGDVSDPTWQLFATISLSWPISELEIKIYLKLTYNNM